MKFNIQEWSFIRLCIEVAQRDFEKQIVTSKQSDEQYSSYQIFLRQVLECSTLIEKINNTEV